VNNLDKETLDKLGIHPEPSLDMAGNRHVALGKVLKAINRLDEDDALWVLQEARVILNKQGGLVDDVLSTDNSSKEVPPLGWSVEVVAKTFELSVSDLKHRAKTANIVQARQVAMYVLGMFDKYTLTEIGGALGGRTPATVSYGFQKIAREIGRDKGLARIVAKIREQLAG